ncbi:MAG: ArnT family glycosyltransferase, partial [Planctomycetota bacterium]
MLWLAGTLITLLTRPPIPPDETRVLAVAWGMWSDSDFLVPQLNGEPYAEKPPLLHWLIHAGWALGGVGEVWPRLLSPLLALLALGLCTRLARQLWPERPLTAALAPLLLAGSLFWIALTPLLLYDTLLTSCSLLALVGLLGVCNKGRCGEFRSAAEHTAKHTAKHMAEHSTEPGTSLGAWLGGWLFVGVALGLGLLAKGPAAWLGFLPVALAAPLWARARRPPSWPTHYGGVLLALAVGAGLFLLWALPACAQAGSAYRETLFGQAAARLAGEERGTHAEPWWWYLPRLLPLLLPWTLWPALWSALAALLRGRASTQPRDGSAPRARLDDGTRFCLLWIGGALTALSIIAGKQEHYLLPLLPACALLAARALADLGTSVRDRPGTATQARWSLRTVLEATLPAMPVLLAGLALWLGQSQRI